MHQIRTCLTVLAVALACAHNAHAQGLHPDRANYAGLLPGKLGTWCTYLVGGGQLARFDGQADEVRLYDVRTGALAGTYRLTDAGCSSRADHQAFALLARRYGHTDHSEAMAHAVFDPSMPCHGQERADEPRALSGVERNGEQVIVRDGAQNQVAAFDLSEKVEVLAHWPQRKCVLAAKGNDIFIKKMILVDYDGKQHGCKGMEGVDKVFAVSERFVRYGDDLWDAETQQALPIGRGYLTSCYRCTQSESISNDGRWMTLDYYSTDRKCQVRIWQLPGLERLLDTTFTEVNDAGLAPDGSAFFLSRATEHGDRVLIGDPRTLRLSNPFVDEAMAARFVADSLRAAEIVRYNAMYDSLVSDLTTHMAERLARKQSVLNSFLSDARNLGWRTSKRIDSPAGAKGYYAQGFHFRMHPDSVYTILHVAVSPIVENSPTFYFEPLAHEMYFGTLSTLGGRHLGVLASGMDASSLGVGLGLQWMPLMPRADSNGEIPGAQGTLLVLAHASKGQLRLPDLDGAPLALEMSSWPMDARYGEALRQYRERVARQAEQARLEAIRKQEWAQRNAAPAPGSALGNLMQQIEAAVPATWPTCGTCHGTGLQQSTCSCCNGRGSYSTQTSEFHRTSEKTDTYYNADGPQGAGYYVRTTPIGYYTQSTVQQACNCCNGSGSLSNSGVCGRCNGAGRVRP
ncbi:MAG: hypothetical protein IPJ85_13615 [Flavobacteriales bacterium]|nr:hypothetical protein [Flavobacteriales bacterium]